MATLSNVGGIIGRANQVREHDMVRIDIDIGRLKQHQNNARIAYAAQTRGALF